MDSYRDPNAPADPTLGERITRLPGAALLIAGYLIGHPLSPYRRVIDLARGRPPV